MPRTERPLRFDRAAAPRDELVDLLERLYQEAGEPTLRDVEAFVGGCRGALRNPTIPALSGQLPNYSYSTFSNALSDLLDGRTRVGARTRRTVAITLAWALTAIATLARAPELGRQLGSGGEPTLRYVVAFWQDCMARRRLAWALDVRRRSDRQADRAASLHDARTRRAGKRPARPSEPGGRRPDTAQERSPGPGPDRPATSPAVTALPGGASVLPFRRFRAEVPSRGTDFVPLRLLGPVRVQAGPDDGNALGAEPALTSADAPALASADVRAVLACLALRISTVVPVNQLVDEVWPEQSPESATTLVARHVAAVNQALADAGTGLSVGAVPGGYQLTGRREQVDWYLFEDLVAQGRVLLRAGEVRAARPVLADALALWRGAALVDVPDVPIRRLFVPVMAASRRAALADRIDADLALGRADLVAELEQLHAGDPRDERLFAQLVQALHRAGRRGDAIALYERVRSGPAAAPPGDPVPVPHAVTSPAQAPTGTALVGRSAELGDLLTLVRGSRLVTVTGPPGVGKSRLAAAVAARIWEDEDGRAWTVGLGAVTDPTALPLAVLGALGGTGSPHRDPVELVRSHLLGREAFLVLDDCDRLLPDCADLTVDLLSRCAQLRILVTSREPLAIPEETTVRLSPLPLPDPRHTSATTVGRAPSVQLFCDRARVVRPGFELSDETAPTVAAICRAVDGLPLALELASARLGLLSAPELLAKLNDQLTLLSRPGQRVPERQRSLRASVATSCDLLSPAEAALFTRLSTPPGEFTLDTAEALARPGPDDPGVMDLLHTLVDRSLVVGDTSGELTRYRMLEPIRQYAASRLTETDGTDARTRLARHLLSVARTASAERRGPGKAHWLRVLDVERASIAAVLTTAVAEGNQEVALELSALLWWWWANNPVEGLGWYRRILAAGLPAPGTAGSRHSLDALLGASVIASFSSPHEAMEYAERARGEATVLGDELGEVRALQHISDCAFEVGDLPLARRTGEEALELAERLGGYAAARCRLTVAYNHLADLDLDRAEHWTRRAGAAFDEIDDDQGRADADLALGVISVLTGGGPAAVGLLDRVLATYRRVDSQEDVAQTAVLLARVRAEAGTPEGCADLLREACDIHTTIRHPWNVANDLDHIAAVAVAWNDPTTAATLLGAADAVRRQAGLTSTPQNQAVREPVATASRSTLGERDHQTAYRSGAGTTLSSALALARTLTEPPR